MSNPGCLMQKVGTICKLPEYTAATAAYVYELTGE